MYLRATRNPAEISRGREGHKCNECVLWHTFRHAPWTLFTSVGEYNLHTKRYLSMDWSSSFSRKEKLQTPVINSPLGLFLESKDVIYKVGHLLSPTSQWHPFLELKNEISVTWNLSPFISWRLYKIRWTLPNMTECSSILRDPSTQKISILGRIFLSNIIQAL